MSRIDETFRSLRRNGRKALIPFLTAGDPDLTTTGLLVQELARRGASLIELGIPYSDPIADGPIIQASYTRALGRGVRLAEIFDAVRQWVSQERVAGTNDQRRFAVSASLAASARLAASASERARKPKAGSEATTPSCNLPPLISMVSYSIVYRYGAAEYIRAAKAAGFDGAIIPDLPVEEAADMARDAQQCDFSLIQLITPTTPPERAAKIAAASSGFIYYVSVTGITGERDRLPQELVDQVARLRDQTNLPIGIGFGISRPEQIRQLRDMADGVIVGSAFIRRISEGAEKGLPPQQLAEQIGQFAAELNSALGG